MALSAARTLPPAVLAIAAAALLSGCAAGPATRAAPSASPQETRHRLAPAPRVETFPRTSEVLRAEIDEKAETLRSGPIGNRARELASLRLAETGRELIVSGSPGGARESLERAVSLYGANGYAYLFLAAVHLAEGRRDQARELAATAKSYLPRDEDVQAELRGLERSLRDDARNSTRPARTFASCSLASTSGGRSLTSTYRILLADGTRDK